MDLQPVLSLVDIEQAALWLVDVEQLWMELDTFRVRGVPSTHHLTTDVQRQRACYTFVHVAGCAWSHILHVVVILNVTLQINSSWSEQYYPDCKTLGLWMSLNDFCYRATTSMQKYQFWVVWSLVSGFGGLLYIDRDSCDVSLIICCDIFVKSI